MFLKTKDKSANFELLETYREGGKTFVVVSTPTSSNAETVKQQAHENGYSFLGSCVRDGKPTVAFSTEKTEEQAVQDIKQHVVVEEVKVIKAPNMWFIRGFMGFTGQLFNLTHAILMGDKALGTFAYLNLGANGMAMAFGAQKKNDEPTLDHIGHTFDHITNNIGKPGMPLSETAQADHEHTNANLRKRDLNVEPGIMGVLRANSVKIQHTLRLIASANILQDGWKTYQKTKTLNPRLIAGGLIVPGKVIGILAKDEDPGLLPQEKKGFWENFKVNANQIGSLIELTGFTLLAYEGVTKKMALTPEKMAQMKPSTIALSKKLKADKGWLQAFGQSLFVASYMVQSVAPLSNKVFPMERALQNASLHLQTLPDDQHGQAMVGMAYALYDTVPQLRREGLAKTLAQIDRVSVSPDQLTAASASLSGKKQPGVNTSDISSPPRRNQTELASRDAAKIPAEGGVQNQEVAVQNGLETTKSLANDATTRGDADSVTPSHLARLEEKRLEAAQKPVLSGNDGGWQHKLQEQDQTQMAMAK